MAPANPNTTADTVRRLDGFTGFMTELGREARRYWNFPCWIDVDMQRVEQVRQRLRRDGVRVTYTAFVSKAIAVAVRQHMARVPELNAAIVHLPLRRIVRFNAIDLCVAAEAQVDGQSVFFGSILRDADDKPLTDLAAELQRCRQSTPQDHQRLGKDLRVMRLPWPLRKLALWLGANVPRYLRQYRGTLFLTSVGQYGVNLVPLGNRNLEFAMGPVEQRPVVRDGRVEVGLRMCLTAVFDHRTLHGAPVARLLAHVRDLLQTVPESWYASPGQLQAEAAQDAPTARDAPTREPIAQSADV